MLLSPWSLFHTTMDWFHPEKEGVQCKWREKNGLYHIHHFYSNFLILQTRCKDPDPTSKMPQCFVVGVFLVCFSGGRGDWKLGKFQVLRTSSWIFLRDHSCWTSGTLHSVQDGSAAYMDSVTPALSPAPHQKISLWGLSWCICLGFELCV